MSPRVDWEICDWAIWPTFLTKMAPQASVSSWISRPKLTLWDYNRSFTAIQPVRTHFSVSFAPVSVIT